MEVFFEELVMLNPLVPSTATQRYTPPLDVSNSAKDRTSSALPIPFVARVRLFPNSSTSPLVEILSQLSCGVTVRLLTDTSAMQWIEYWRPAVEFPISTIVTFSWGAEEERKHGSRNSRYYAIA